MEIRVVEESEHAALGELTAETYLADGHLVYGRDDPYLPALRDVAARARDAEVLVAVEDGQVLGGITLASEPGPMTQLAKAGECEIRMLVVGHAARGRGLGEALVRECIERSRARGLHRMLLYSATTQSSAQRIYRRLGFVRVPSRDWSPLADRPDLTLMVFELALQD